MRVSRLLLLLFVFFVFIVSNYILFPRLFSLDAPSHTLKEFKANNEDNINKQTQEESNPAPSPAPPAASPPPLFSPSDDPDILDLFSSHTSLMQTALEQKQQNKQESLYFPLPAALSASTPSSSLAATSSDFSSISSFSPSLIADLFEPWRLNKLIEQVNQDFGDAANSSSSTAGAGLTVIVFACEVSQSATNAAQGNTMGELLYWRALINGLYHIHTLNKEIAFTRYIAIDGPSLFAFRSRSSLMSLFDSNRLVLITSGYAIGPLHDLFKDSEADWERLRSCFIVLDDWGTPKHQDWFSLHLAQYAVPWNYEKTENFVLGNYLSTVSDAFQTFLGASLTPLARVFRAAHRLGPDLSLSSLSLSAWFDRLPWRVGRELLRAHPLAGKKKQIMIWGKEDKYFASPVIFRLLDRLQNGLGVRVLVTGKAAVTARLPPNVTNIGLTSEADRERLLMESLALVGLGDPVLGMTPFQGLKYGTTYINPLYRTTKTFSMNSQQTYKSQHPFVEQLPEPIVYSYFLEDGDELTRAVGIVEALVGNQRAYGRIVDKLEQATDEQDNISVEALVNNGDVKRFNWQMNLPYFPLEMSFPAFVRRLTVAVGWARENGKKLAKQKQTP